MKPLSQTFGPLLRPCAAVVLLLAATACRKELPMTRSLAASMT